MTLLPPYHVGYVVPDLEAALDSVGHALGLTWTPVADRVRRVSVGAADLEVRFRFVYSLEGPPYVELVEHVPGSIWVGDPAAIHHVGHWSDDVRTDSDRLVGSGLERVAWAVSEPPDTWRWAYHRHPGGAYLELVDVSVRVELEERFRQARG